MGYRVARACLVIACTWSLVPAAGESVGVEFTVSGHSSGGSMASQHFMAFSESVLGLGHFQAAPYSCSRQSGPASQCTTSPQNLDVASMIEYTEQSAEDGKIDDPANLGTHPIWVFGGGTDSIVLPLVCSKAAELYRHFAGNVQAEELAGCQHAFATDLEWSGSNACGVLRAPFINFCGYDMAGKMLAHLYGDLNARVQPVANHFVEIDQTVYFAAGYGARQIGMGETGYVYLPDSCADEPGSCSVHVMYHGCSGSVWSVGTDIMTHAGLNNWAESNGIIVLYPQAFQGFCWDWNGAILSPPDAAYDTRDGVQLRTMNRMIADLRAQLSALSVRPGVRWNQTTSVIGSLGRGVLAGKHHEPCY